MRRQNSQTWTAAVAIDGDPHRTVVPRRAVDPAHVLDGRLLSVADMHAGCRRDVRSALVSRRIGRVGSPHTGAGAMTCGHSAAVVRIHPDCSAPCNGDDVGGRSPVGRRVGWEARSTACGDEAVTTYRGPRRFTPRGTRVVREVVRLGDFEAVLTWAVGLTEQRPYSVERSGHRVILEVR